MKVHVIGGGPAGVYFAILAKKAWPQTRITVFERNRPDDTFGFGVVFSDETLDTFETYDRESYRAIVGHFAYWAGARARSASRSDISPRSRRSTPSPATPMSWWSPTESIRACARPSPTNSS